MKTTGQNKKRQNHSFTLVELLVVISIIGLLAVLLFPYLSKAILQAKINASLSNLRQIGLVVQQYTTENNGVYPKLQDDKVPGNDGTWLSKLWPTAYPNRSMPGYGSKLKGSIFYTPLLEPESTARTFGWNGVIESYNKTRMYDFLPSPSQIALVGDVNETSSLFPTTIKPRNNNMVNVLFIDGHVASTSTNDIPTTQTKAFWTGKP